jgi:hypothetical protein
MIVFSPTNTHSHIVDHLQKYSGFSIQFKKKLKSVNANPQS